VALSEGLALGENVPVLAISYSSRRKQGAAAI